MINEIKARVKSKDEIMNTLEGIDIISGTTYGVLKSDKDRKLKKDKVGSLSIPDCFWSVCGKNLTIKDSSSQTHQYDYHYFDYPKEYDEDNTTNVLYFMDEWIEKLDNNEAEQTELFN